MKIGDSVIVIWRYNNNSIKVGDIGKITEIYKTSFRAVFKKHEGDNYLQGFYINNEQNELKYKKYNYRKEKLERILK